jgi:hypothetical protein
MAGVTSLMLAGGFTLASLGNLAVDATGLSVFVGNGPAAPALAAVALAGGVIGGFAALGAVASLLGPDHHRIQGTVTKSEDGLKFSSSNQKFEVDLEEYAQAKVPPKVDGKREFGDQWWTGAPIHEEFSPESVGEQRW